MAQPKTLTEQQVIVLRWIAAGASAQTMPGEYAHISAGALRNRGLVTTKGRGATWSAMITPTGKAYLATVDGPNPPTPRKSNASQPDLLVSEVVVAGGTLRVPRFRWHDPGGVNYEQRVADAQRRGKVAAGSWLEVHPISDSEQEIVLITPPVDVIRPITTVAVPEHVTRFNAFVREFRDLAVRREVSLAQMPRALRMIQGIAEEATGRGHELKVAPNRDDHRGSVEWSGSKDGHFVMTVGHHSEVVRIYEGGLPTAHYREWRSYYGSGEVNKTKPPKPVETDRNATGRLKLELLGYSRDGRPSKWADRKHRPLEDALGELFWEVEVRAYQVEQRRLAEKRAAAERQRAWEAAKADALAQFNEHRRIDALNSQLTNWRSATEIRAFCESLRQLHGENKAAREWIAWALGYADSIDPMTLTLGGPPPVSSARHDQLAPFMNGWSATEPVRR